VVFVQPCPSPAAPRFHAFALDQRGFGDSERPDAGYRVDDFAAAAVAFLDAVDLPRAIFVGHSFGSLVARRIAIAYAERVARLVLIGTGVTRGNPVLREVGATMRDLEDPIPVEFAREFQASTAYAPIPEAFFERIVAESMKLPSRLWRAIFDALVAYDDAAEADRINAPMLLLWGEHDALFPRADQDRLVSAIREATLRVYADTGHCPNWECPERVAADIEEFLEKS
jgi:pimeloyl-ACP methyl ester carboxylesterase